MEQFVKDCILQERPNARARWKCEEEGAAEITSYNLIPLQHSAEEDRAENEGVKLSLERKGGREACFCFVFVSYYATTLFLIGNKWIFPKLNILHISRNWQAIFQVLSWSTSFIILFSCPVLLRNRSERVVCWAPGSHSALSHRNDTDVITVRTQVFAVITERFHS